MSTDVSTAVLRPVGDDGVLARRGDLVVLCAAGLRTDAVLGALHDVSRSGGDAAGLADRLAAMLTDGTVDVVAFGPSGSTVTVAIFGHAWADVATVHGEQRLALKESVDGVRSSLPGRLVSIRAGLGDVDAAGEPQRWGDLEAGTVHARGLLYLADDDADVDGGAPVAAAPEPAVEQTLNSVPVADVLEAAAPAPQPAPEPASAPPAAFAAPRARGEATVPPSSETTPPPGSTAPSEPPRETFGAPEIDRSQPFSSVVFVQAAGAAPQVEHRAPLPVVDAPLPAPAPNTAPAAHPASDDVVEVLGVYCKNGHFDDPAARYCAVCGISMAQLTLVPRPGPRPPLGVLVMDDGSIFTLDKDYIVGRNPDRNDAVTSGQARPLRLDDRRGLLSRAHLRIRLDGWQVQVVDLGSVNGTGILPPRESAWQRLPSNTPITIRPGTELGFGQRKLRYESHTNT